MGDRREPQERVLAYVRGLSAPLERKNSSTLAEQAGEAIPDGVQRLLAYADWDADAVRDDVHDYAVEHLARLLVRHSLTDPTDPAYYLCHGPEAPTAGTGPRGPHPSGPPATSAAVLALPEEGHRTGSGAGRGVRDGRRRRGRELVMTNEPIRDALVAAGYEFVHLEPRIPDAKSLGDAPKSSRAADAAETLVRADERRETPRSQLR